MLAKGILGSGQTSGVSFRPFPNSSGWWWLISSVFLIRISCHKTTQANGYYGAWPGRAVSISVLPLIQWGLYRIGLAGWGEGHPESWLGWTVSFFEHHAKKAGGIIRKPRTHQGKSTLLTGQLSVSLSRCMGVLLSSLIWALSPHRFQDYRFAFKLIMGFPNSSAGKESTCNAGDPGLIPGSGRFPEEGIDYPFQYSWASQMTQTVKNLPAIRDTWVWTLAWEDPLEKGTASVFLPGEFHGQRSLASCTVHEVTKSRTQRCNFHFFTLLRHNSPTIKFILLKYTIQWLLVFSKNCTIIS